jgi:hypothetical protein
MGEVNFVAFDSETGRPTASISGSPVDVADFISIWMKNNEEGVSLARQLGVDFGRPFAGTDDGGEEDDE